MHYVTLLVQMFMLSRVSHWFAYSDIASVHNWCTNVECCLCCCLQRVFWEQIRTGCYYSKHSEQVATFHIWVFSIKKTNLLHTCCPVCWVQWPVVTAEYSCFFSWLLLRDCYHFWLAHLRLSSVELPCSLCLDHTYQRCDVKTFTSYVVIYDTMHNV